MRDVRPLTLGVLIGLAQACGGAQMLNDPELATGQVPSALASEIEDRWPEYQIVNAPSGECAGRRLASASSVIAADLNGDRLGDIALRISSSGSTRVVAGLRRLNDDDEFEVHVVAEGAAEADSQLDLGPQGSAYKPAGLAVDAFFSTDTLLLTRCGAGATGFFWNGAGFTPRAIE